jgi:hypothetical protein
MSSSSSAAAPAIDSNSQHRHVAQSASIDSTLEASPARHVHNLQVTSPDSLVTTTTSSHAPFTHRSPSSTSASGMQFSASSRDDTLSSTSHTKSSALATASTAQSPISHTQSSALSALATASNAQSSTSHTQSSALETASNTHSPTGHTQSSALETASNTQSPPSHTPTFDFSALATASAQYPTSHTPTFDFSIRSTHILPSLPPPPDARTLNFYSNAPNVTISISRLLYETIRHHLHNLGVAAEVEDLPPPNEFAPSFYPVNQIPFPNITGLPDPIRPTYASNDISRQLPRDMSTTRKRGPDSL